MLLSSFLSHDVDWVVRECGRLVARKTTRYSGVFGSMWTLDSAGTWKREEKKRKWVRMIDDFFFFKQELSLLYFREGKAAENGSSSKIFLAKTPCSESSN